MAHTPEWEKKDWIVKDNRKPRFCVFRSASGARQQPRFMSESQEKGIDTRLVK